MTAPYEIFGAVFDPAHPSAVPQGPLNFQPLALAGAAVLRPPRYEDSRGHLMETFHAGRLSALGIDAAFVQDNYSASHAPLTLRGLHYQRAPFAQAKLVRVLHGRIFDVAVDLRRASATFGQWVGVMMSAEGGEQMYVPAGFAHGFLTLEPHTEVAYKLGAHYAPHAARAIAWNDPEIGIAWPLLGARPILSATDAVAPPLAAAELEPLA